MEKDSCLGKQELRQKQKAAADVKEKRKQHGMEAMVASITDMRSHWQVLIDEY